MGQRGTNFCDVGHRCVSSRRGARRQTRLRDPEEPGQRLLPPVRSESTDLRLRRDLTIPRQLSPLRRRLESTILQKGVLRSQPLHGPIESIEWKRQAEIWQPPDRSMQLPLRDAVEATLRLGNRERTMRIACAIEVPLSGYGILLKLEATG